MDTSIELIFLPSGTSVIIDDNIGNSVLSNTL